MQLRDFLSRLRVESGPNASGEYMCRCPAHDDQKASLCVRDGEKGIVLCCQTGVCTAEAVVRAMGLEMRDLFHESAQRPAAPAREGADKSAAKPKAQSAPKQTQSAPKEIEKVYPYVDEDGKVLFEVVRFIPKDFRQRVPDPSARGGYRWSIKGVRPIIYRLPDVIKAIRDERTVYVVEGEKDADNMALLGYTATTSPMGAGKWRSEHSALLSGAIVCVLPDNDDPGRDHADKVAKALLDTAKSVKILDIASACPGLPEKGDISDFFKLLGRQKGAEALAKLEAETAAQEALPSDERSRAAALYVKVGGYCVANGCICQSTDDGARKLCTFTALPSKIITRDDGVNIDKIFQIDGWTASGRALPQVMISAAKYPSMNWVLENWDFAANIMPGNMIKDRLRYAITEVGEMNAQRETEYTHTGWRKIGGKWAYLYPGGAVGADNVRVELDSALMAYTLDKTTAEGGEFEAALASYFFKDSMAAHISIPLLGLVYLTPLREFLSQCRYSPRFAMFLLGGTGTHKSTAAALALAHFGEFSVDNLPASFHDTANSIRKKAFILKDNLLVVDDYHPETSMQERRRMEATAQSLARAFGDGADRGRMKADLSLQEAMPPRGIALMSGEDMPNIGESGAARFYTITIGKNDIPITDELEAEQEMARNGMLRKAMRGYIAWLAARVDSLSQRLPEIYVKLRKQAIKQGGGSHGRAAEAVAHVMLGYEMMLRYMADVGALTQEAADKEFREAWAIVMENSERQGRDAQDDRPSLMFLSAVSEMLISKAVSVKDLTAMGGTEPGNMVGYVDNAFYYLMPDMIFTKVSKLYADQGMAFPLTKRMLYKQMKDDGLLMVDADGKASRPKNINGKVVRLLWIERSRIDGSKPAQTAQEQLTINGFTVVSDADKPF